MLPSVHHIAQRLAAQGAQDFARGLGAEFDAAFLAVKRGVRVQQKPVVRRVVGIAPRTQHRRISGWRLLFEHVDARAGEMAAQQRGAGGATPTAVAEMLCAITKST